MATTKEFKDYIIDQLNILDDITLRPMMGEYLLYYKGVLFGGLYDDRLLVKKTDSNKKYGLSEEIPYDSTKKTMYFIENTDDVDLMKDIILDTYKDL